ncbi:hypothetical protein TNCV_2692241 [Trichonephila clavipes]|uniref:Uncharacterized protein n=1 Tax=Trichonephila clavipes TaxID=2585209 RepID=A0A8X6VYW7_TRICX|nr:hypothetical protein TNCV_2692241 [Trichonephila clavipes]
MPSPGFEPRRNGTAVSLTNHYIGWVAGPQPLGQKIGVNVHCTQHPIREQPLSPPPSQKTQKTFHPDEAP